MALGKNAENVSGKPLSFANGVIEHVVSTFNAFRDASSPVSQAVYLVELQNAISDLSTYHPDWNVDTGEIEYEYED